MLETESDFLELYQDTSDMSNTDDTEPSVPTAANLASSQSPSSMMLCNSSHSDEKPGTLASFPLEEFIRLMEDVEKSVQ